MLQLQSNQHVDQSECRPEVEVGLSRLSRNVSHRESWNQWTQERSPRREIERLHLRTTGFDVDDGYGVASVIDYLDATKEMIRPDSGPPLWFCPIECGPPIKGSPILLFLPSN
ncbi:hypothetical protein MRB53_028661 [Persea americana]|uniref:Uncharacterized protein n=1 Tax=Persea americana TaxID=3435 RepID=A0ACC2KGM1_PERAE|nr:hypothetical protein MRB53_028661 [Persea americana]